MHDPTSAADPDIGVLWDVRTILSPFSWDPAVREPPPDSTDNAFRDAKRAIHAFPGAGLLVPVAQYQNAWLV
jgi:hypothetical protein